MFRTDPDPSLEKVRVRVLKVGFGLNIEVQNISKIELIFTFKLEFHFKTEFNVEFD